VADGVLNLGRAGCIGQLTTDRPKQANHNKRATTDRPQNRFRRWRRRR